MAPDLEKILAQSALDGLKRDNDVYDALDRLVDNVIDLKQENRALFTLVQKQQELLQNLAANVIRNQQILSAQQERINQIGLQVEEQQRIIPSVLPRLLEGQTKLYPQIIDSYDKLAEDFKEQKLLLTKQNERFNLIEVLLKK